MRYKANITAGGLKVPESRIVSDLLLQGMDWPSIRQQVLDANIFQYPTPGSGLSIGGLIHARLNLMGPKLWEMVRDSEKTTASQACLAAAIKHSPLLGDFMDSAIRQCHRQRLTELPRHAWEDFLLECRAHDQAMPQWKDATQRRLRSSVYQALAQAGYLTSTKSPLLQKVHLSRPLNEYLLETGEAYVIRCMEAST